MQVVLMYYAWYVKLLLPSSFLLILTSKQSMIYVCMYTYYLLVLLHTYSVVNEKKLALKILHSFLKVYNPIYTPRTLVVKLGYDDAASKNISLSY